jgi:hypothetical protein
MIHNSSKFIEGFLFVVSEWQQEWVKILFDTSCIVRWRRRKFHKGKGLWLMNTLMGISKLL